MKTIQLPEVPVTEIFLALRKTPAGKSLRETARFGMFRDSEPASHWRRVLGPSAITYSHMIFVHKVTGNFLKEELRTLPKKFNLKDQKSLLLAAACHDFGEAIIDDQSIGDIPFIHKTRKHEEIEQKIFLKVIKSLDLNPDLKNEISKSYTKVIGGGNFLSKFFRTIEHAEYLMTALNVFRNSLKKGLEIKHGKLLIGNVLCNNTSHLTEDTLVEYPSARLYLHKNTEQIRQAFEYVYAHYKKSEFNGFKNNDIDTAYKIWRSFSNF